jgi:outer membrane protein OmpA-like peptidoglycan-associated protein
VDAGGEGVYQYDDDDEGERSRRGVVIAVVAVVLLAALGWFVARPLLTGDEEQTGSPLELAGSPTATDSDASAASAAESRDSDRGGPAVSDGDGDNADRTAAAAAATTPERTEAPSTTTAPTTTRAPTTTERTTTTTAPPTTTLPPTTLPPTTVAQATYESLPDGSPAPVIAIFDAGVVTLTGAVPSQAAVDRLGALALANSRDPAATTVNNLLTINPAVPINVGVRVIELTSSRFPEGSSEILPEQALEFDRVVTVMNALPNVTALVIGHADQRGSELANFVLSESRAQAATAYLAARGIAPSRLAARAVGEADLLTLNDDAAALALNRRTEFVFYGLLLE